MSFLMNRDEAYRISGLFDPNPVWTWLMEKKKENEMTAYIATAEEDIKMGSICEVKGDRIKLYRSTKELTVSEIEKKLGYKVKIVKEK